MSKANSKSKVWVQEMPWYSPSNHWQALWLFYIRWAIARSCWLFVLFRGAVNQPQLKSLNCLWANHRAPATNMFYAPNIFTSETVYCCSERGGTVYCNPVSAGSWKRLTWPGLRKAKELCSAKCVELNQWIKSGHVTCAKGLAKTILIPVLVVITPGGSGSSLWRVWEKRWFPRTWDWLVSMEITKRNVLKDGES